MAYSVPMPATQFSAVNVVVSGHVTNDSVTLSWNAPKPSGVAPRTGWRVRWADTSDVIAEFADSTSVGTMSLACQLDRSLENKSVVFELVAYNSVGESEAVTSGEVFGRLSTPVLGATSRAWDSCDELITHWADTTGTGSYQHLLEFTFSNGTYSFTKDVRPGTEFAGEVVVPLDDSPDPDGFLLSAVTTSLRVVPASSSLDRNTHASVPTASVVAAGTHGVTSGIVSRVMSSGRSLCDIAFDGAYSGSTQTADSYVVTFVGGDKANVSFAASQGTKRYDQSVVSGLRFEWQAAEPLYVVVTAIRNGFSSKPYEFPSPYEFAPAALVAPTPIRVWCESPSTDPELFKVSFGDAVHGTPFSDSGNDAYRYMVTVNGTAASLQEPSETENIVVGSTHEFQFSMHDPSQVRVGIRAIDAAGAKVDSLGTTIISFSAANCTLYAYQVRLLVVDCDVRGSGSLCWAYQSNVSTDRCRFAGIGTGSAYYKLDAESLCFEGDDEFE